MTRPPSPALGDLMYAPALRGERSTGGDPTPGPEHLLDHFQMTAPGRFFAGPVDAATPSLFTQLAPEARARVVAAAESVCLGRFDLLGHRGLSFGDPIDWHLDPLSGRRSSLVHWSLIDPTDVAAVGDSKVVWELNRHQFLVTLGIAYRTTGDERYAQTFASLVHEWLCANPPGMGINWASSLEAALRIVSWSWALVLLRKSAHLTPELFAEMLAGIGAQAAHVERYLSRHFSPNTHLTGEALGLFYAGVVFPASKSAARWQALGQSILDSQVQRQVLDDGVYFEQASAYQRYTVDIYLHYLILAARNGITVPPAVGDRVQRMLDALLALRRPDGGMPAIGDSDGGLLLPMVPRAAEDLRGTFAVAGAFFGRSDYAWAAEGLQSEALWFMGPEATATFARLDLAPPQSTSRAFADGGYVVMRSGWTRDAHHAVFDVGPLGCPMTGAHGHADLLSVQVSPFGEPGVVDPGTYTYAADPQFRSHFRGTSAHSTVLVDGRGQAEPLGPFTWHDRPSARLRRFFSTPAFDFADASHDAYRRLPGDVVHRRRIAFVKDPGYWVLADDLEGADEHRVELRFQLAPRSVSETADGWVRMKGPDARGMLLRAFASEPLDLRVKTGSTFPIEGWVSHTYGQREPAPILIYGITARLPLRVLTVLLPTQDAEAEPPTIQQLVDQDGLPCGLSFVDRNETVRFEADSFSVEAMSCTA